MLISLELLSANYHIYASLYLLPIHVLFPLIEQLARVCAKYPLALTGESRGSCPAAAPFLGFS